jgi:mono/diheme cytochrome c family protein
VSWHPTGKKLNPFSWNLLGPVLGFSLISAIFISLPALDALAEPGGDPKLGKAIYTKRCASCHGQNGDGLGSGSTLPNFSDAKTMAEKTDRELLDKISNGGRGTGMPAWKKVLSESERRNVLAYIRALARP